MKTSKILGRVAKIKVTIIFDCDKVIEIDTNTEQLLASPGIDSIQSTGTILGSLIGNPIEQWVKDNPIPTQLQKDLKAGLVYITRYNSVEHDKEGKSIIKAFTVKGYEEVIYNYSDYSEAYDDLIYCRNKFKDE